MGGPRRLFAVLLAAVPIALGSICGGFQTIVIDEPIATLVDEPVAVAARVGGNFTLSTVKVRVNGVDLIAALGLTPPFTNISGTVAVGPDLVTISGFTFATTAPRQIDLVVAGLSPGSHSAVVEGVKSGSGQLVVKTAPFDVVASFALGAEIVAASAHEEPEVSGAEGELFGATLGDPFAAAPVGLSGGGELRSGFVEVSEALIAGAGP